MGLSARATVGPAAAQPVVQLIYSRLLDWGAKGGFMALALSFTVYLFGWMPALVSVQELPALWNQPVAAYLAQTGTPTGWGWLAMATRADLANLVGIALLAGSSLPPLAAVFVLCAKRGERGFAALCALQMTVLVLAASGVLTLGH